MERETTYGGTHGKRHPGAVRYRPMTVEEAKALAGYAFVLDDKGKARKCKVNGRPHVWKRDPGRVEVPLKYGMYEYLRDTSDPNDPAHMTRLIVLID